MPLMKRFEACLSRPCEVPGHADRDQPMREYCTGLMLALERTTLGAIAAHVRPQAVRGLNADAAALCRQHGVVDEATLRGVRDYVFVTM